MAVLDRHSVAAAFDGASDYSDNAGVQRRIAADLAEKIVGIDFPTVPRILEIGCGTGFLTQALLDRGLDGDWLITDKSPDMIRRCREALGDAPGRTFAVLDGEYGSACQTAPYHLICASMAMQWFDDLAAATGRLVRALAPGGHLVFNTLASETFSEWREAHRAGGQGEGAIAFPSVPELRSKMEQLGLREFSVANHTETHRDAREFLRRLKLIGAATAPSEHRPLAPAALKNVMARFDSGGGVVTYQVVTCHLVRPAD